MMAGNPGDGRAMLEEGRRRLSGRLARTAARGSAWLADWRDDSDKNAAAARIYRTILSQDPARALSPATERLIAAYAGDVLGGAVDAPWLRVYAAFRGGFREGWLPPTFLQRVVRPQLDRQHALSGSKTLSRRLLGTTLLPDRVTRVRGCWLDRDGAPISQAAARALVFAGADLAFLKRDGIQRGAGVMTVDPAGFDAAAATIPGDFVVQELVRQHPSFDIWNTSSLATLRLVTFKPEGAAAALRAGYLRVGRAGDAAVRSARAVKVPIDLPDGRLADGAVLPDWRRVDRHPDSGAPFAGLTLPGLGRIADELRALHDRLPHVAMIGWDAILDADDRVVVLEWGSGGIGLKFAEAATGPHFPELARRDWRAALTGWPEVPGRMVPAA